jgi:hypothetical protein
MVPSTTLLLRRAAWVSRSELTLACLSSPPAPEDIEATASSMFAYVMQTVFATSAQTACSRPVEQPDVGEDE